MLPLPRVIFAFLLLLGPVCVARQDPTFFSKAELVVLHVNVRDRDGRFLANLPKESFSVFEDGQPQPVSVFAHEDTPVTAGLLIDNSNSMQEARELVIAAATEFARAGHEQDEFFALAFNEDVAPVLSPAFPFTSDPAVLKAALTRSISARGRTAFFDAVAAGLEYAARGTQPRKVLVVISDGGDNASETTFATVLRQTQASHVTIYGVVLADPLDREANPRRLTDLAKSSGGVAFTPKGRTQVASALQDIAQEIRHTYLLGYAPSRPPDGTFRQLRVTVTTPDRRRVVVRTRAGYLSPSPSGTK